MTNRHVRAVAAGLMAKLPDLPRPWGIEELCDALAQQRGRPLTVHPVDLPGLPFGLWYDDGVGDRVLYRSSATGYYRDHIILHEICHLLAGHGVSPQELAEQSAQEARSTQGEPGEQDEQDPEQGPAAARARSAACNNVEEELAETFASMVLRRAGQLPADRVSAVERRAEQWLGAGRA
ncbi:hypothetical protein GCM10009665_04810 [Kitasatospora nipponensis]|uniref:IrrE N-terminal-like domain-containing protein n=1 Tax=Kitasatospora nipponensis TaxID=258049 RepID=A0ABP4GBX1_9ACTN